VTKPALLLASVTALLFPTGSAAQPVRHAAPANFYGGLLKPYRNAWNYTVTLPDGSTHPQGIWTDELIRTKRDSRDVFVRIQGTVLVNGTTTSVINVFDPKTLFPVSDQQSLKDGGLQKRTFTEKSVTSTRPGTKGVPAISRKSLPSPIYDYYGGMYALLLATAPLRPGFSGTFTSIDEFTDDPVPVEFRVLGRESVRAGGKALVKAWKVEAERPGQYQLIAWVVQKPPYVIRLNIITPDKRLYDWSML